MLFSVCSPEGDVFALFPSEKDRNLIMSYQHLGQHSLASPELVCELRPATPAERANLLAELKSIGYHLRDFDDVKVARGF